MQVFINRSKSGKRKKRSQLDPEQTSAFLNRPVKKLEDLNRNLKNSYTKDFFKGSRFKHFETLKKLRKGQENDSISSSDHNDEDYEICQQKKRMVFLREQQMPKKVSEVRLQQKKLKERRSRSRQPIHTFKQNKKIAKRPPFQRIESSLSSSSRSSHQSNSKSSLKRMHVGLGRQTETKKTDLSLTDEKLESATKQEAPPRLQPYLPAEKNDPTQTIENGEACNYTSSQLSDQPQQSNLLNNPKGESANLLNKIINQGSQQEKVDHTEQVQSQDDQSDQMQLESSVESLESVEMVFSQSDQNFQEKQDADNNEATPSLSPPIIDKRSSSRLTINSKVIVESIYMQCGPKMQAYPTGLNINIQEQCAKLFVHAPCCIYSHQRHKQNGDESQSEGEESPSATPVSKDPSPPQSGQIQTKLMKNSYRKKKYSKGIHESYRHSRIG